MKNLSRIVTSSLLGIVIALTLTFHLGLSWYVILYVLAGIISGLTLYSPRHMADILLASGLLIFDLFRFEPKEPYVPHDEEEFNRKCIEHMKLCVTISELAFFLLLVLFVPGLLAAIVVELTDQPPTSAMTILVSLMLFVGLPFIWGSGSEKEKKFFMILLREKMQIKLWGRPFEEDDMFWSFRDLGWRKIQKSIRLTIMVAAYRNQLAHLKAAFGFWIYYLILTPLRLLLLAVAATTWLLVLPFFILKATTEDKDWRLVAFAIVIGSACGIFTQSYTWGIATGLCYSVVGYLLPQFGKVKFWNPYRSRYFQNLRDSLKGNLLPT